MVERQAIWQVPKRVQVQSTARVGLVIGDAAALRTQIRELVPESYPKAAGQVKVGSTISVQLTADPSDASVTPQDAVDKSTGEHTALLWTWFIRATHPNPDLFLTAEIVVKMSDGHVLSNELPLDIPGKPNLAIYTRPDIHQLGYLGQYRDCTVGGDGVDIAKTQAPVTCSF